MARRFDALGILAVSIDGIVMAGQSVVVAIGVGASGDKHLLGLTLGASENATVVTDLLADFGERALVQRCRVHKLKNVLDYLPDSLKPQLKATLNAAFKLAPKEGIAKLKQQALWLKREHPQAAASLLEGLKELFTVNRLGLTPRLLRCLASTNLIENPSGRLRTIARHVTRWRDGEMIMRWAALCYLEAEKGWRKIQGHRDLWILRQALGWPADAKRVDLASKVA